MQVLRKKEINTKFYFAVSNLVVNQLGAPEQFRKVLVYGKSEFENRGGQG